MCIMGDMMLQPVLCTTADGNCSRCAAHVWRIRREDRTCTVTGFGTRIWQKTTFHVYKRKGTLDKQNFCVASADSPSID